MAPTRLHEAYKRSLHVGVVARGGHAREGVEVVDPEAHGAQHHGEAAREAASVVLAKHKLDAVGGGVDRTLREAALADGVQLLQHQLLHLHTCLTLSP